mgnify:CR=1 FL=1
MDYETLINLKFKRTEGSVDLTKSKWSSVVINEANYREETVDYSSAGRFDNGEAAYLDGEFSVINKVTGKNLSLDLNADEFTFALWVNCDFTKMNMKQYLLCGNNQIKSSNNSIYLQPDKFKTNMSIVLVSSTGTKIEIPFIENSRLLLTGRWVWLRLTKSNDNKINFYINNELIGISSTITSSFKLVFNNNETCIGKGYDADYLYYPHFKGYIDDFVLVKGLSYNKAKIPSTYFLNEIDPSLLEDAANVWEEKEREFSQYDSITNTIEWKRFNTKEEIDKREQALIPYMLTPIWKQCDINLPTWIKPVLTNPYRINDKVIYNINQIYNNTIDFNTEYPDAANGWKLIHNTLDDIKEWEEPNKYYNYMDKVLYNKRVYQSQVNYNTELPAAWMVLTALTNSEKEELDDDSYKWNKETEYTFKDRVKYNNKYYISIMNNNLGYIPGDTTYWKEVSGSTSFITDWIKPTTYKNGDIVSYNGKYYHSNIDYNILTPGNHHVEWTEITYWEQPKYKNVYVDGDKVFYKGKTYICNLTKDSSGNYRYHEYSIVAPDKYANKKYYKALYRIIPKGGNYYDPRDAESIFWQEIPKSEITDYSLYKEWVIGNVYITGDLVVATDYDWKQTFISEGFFQNKQFTIDRDDTTIKIKLYDAWDNHYLSNDKDRIYFKKNYLEAFNLNEVDGYILMINNKFIKWTNIDIIRSDRFVTLSIKKPSSFVVKDVVLIRLPCKVIYSETGYMPDNGIKLFGFDTNGNFGNDINIYAVNNRLRELVYTDTKFDNIFIDTNLDHKITKSNLFVFDEDGKFITRDNYTISSANVFTYIPIDTGKKYTLYCIWDDTEDSNEDNLALIPNDTRVRQYLRNYNTNTNMDNDYPVDLQQLNKEFDYSVVQHTSDKRYDDNISNSMNGIFNYNKNKFDSVYEEVRPVNIEEYSEAYMNSLKRNIRITIDETNLPQLLHSYIVEGTNLIELCDENKNKYIGKTVIMKLRQYLSVTLTKSNIDSYVGKVAIDGSDNIIITEDNKNNLIGKTVKFNTSNLFIDNTVNNFDSIIMSRDIYNKYDYKNNTYVMLFKRGMLPEWYNKIQYTNDKFYFTDIPRADYRTIYMEEYEKQYIQVMGKEGEFYNGKTTRSFKVEDGTDFETGYEISVIADYGYTAGKVKESPGIVTSDSWIRAYEPEINFYTVTVVTSPHQHIKGTIISNKEGYDLSTLEKLSYTDTTFRVPYNTTVNFELTADKGYTAGELNYNSIVVTKDTTIKAAREVYTNDYTIRTANLYKDIIDISIEYKDKEYKDVTVNAKYGDTFKVITTMLNDRYKFTGLDYNKDTIGLNDDGSYTLLEDTLISVKEPVENAHRFYIYDNSDMAITAKNYGIDNTVVVSCTNNEDMKIINRDIIKVNVKPNSNYNVASPLLIEGTPKALTKPDIESNQAELNYTITAGETDIRIRASNTEIRYFTINIPDKDNQTITIKYVNPVDSGTYTTTKSVSVPYGTTYTITVTPNEGYNAGTANPSSGTVTSTVNINVTDATKIRYKVYLNAGNGQTIVMTPALNSDGTYDWGTKWSATLVAWKGFKAGSIFSATNGTCYSDISVNATAASLTSKLLSVKYHTPVSGLCGFAGMVFGQQKTEYNDTGTQAGIKLLYKYTNEPQNWVEIPNNFNHGTLYTSYHRTYYNAIRVTCPYNYACINIDAKWVNVDDGNGNVHGFKIIDEQWLKGFAIAGGGGGKHPYGEGQLHVTLTVPGISGSISFKATWSISTN